MAHGGDGPWSPSRLLLAALVAGLAHCLRLAGEDDADAGVPPRYEIGGQKLCIRDVGRADGKICKFISQRLCAGFHPREYKPKELSGPVNLCFAPKRSCAIVGSSANLLNTSYGGKIDSHDFVIRMNEAPTGREDWTLESHVGSKTDVRFLSRHAHGVHSERNLAICNFLTEPDMPCGAQCAMSPRSCDAQCELGRNVSCRSMERNNRFARQEPPEWGNNIVVMDHMHGGIAQLLTDGQPSVGLKAFAWAMHSCESIDLFGFGKSCSDKVGARYYDNLGTRLQESVYTREFDWLFGAALTGTEVAAQVPEEIRGWATVKSLRMFLPKCLKDKLNFHAKPPKAKAADATAKGGRAAVNFGLLGSELVGGAEGTEPEEDAGVVFG